MVTVNEAIRILPRLMIDRFYDEHNVMVEDREGESEMARSMLDLDGWEFIGWAYAENIISGGKSFSYLCMFEKQNTRVWCQISETNFLHIASHFWPSVRGS